MAIPSEKILDKISQFLTRQDALLEYIAKAEKSRETRDEKILETLLAIAKALGAAVPGVPAVSLVKTLPYADDLEVYTFDLGTAREKKDVKAPNMPANTIALTIWRNTGTFDLYIQKADDAHKVTVDAITYPQTFLLDDFDLKNLWVTNTAQSGKEAILIAWFKSL